MSQLLVSVEGFGHGISILLDTRRIGSLASPCVRGRYQRDFELLGGVMLVTTGLYPFNTYFTLVGY